jgi:ZIP family zinc transporter
VNPTLTVLAYSGLAAGASVLGVLPLVGRPRLPVRTVGWANACAAGVMLGAAYLLMRAGFQAQASSAAAGAALGIGAVALAHAASGTTRLDLNRLEPADPVYAYRVLLVNWLHSAAEGVAIGAAMAVHIPFGVFVALAMALHNVPEATVTAAVLRGQRVGAWASAGLAVVTNSSQVLFAVATFAVVAAAPAALPGALGAAVGALVYLVLSELLPESYRQAGHTTIALVAALAMGVVVFAGDRWLAAPFGG